MIKRGQVTMFIILAIAIVAIVALVFLFWKDIKSFVIETEPATSVKNCLSKSINDAKTKAGMQGGSMNPSNFLLYQDNKLDYLCYINEFYKTCMIQQPMLKEHFEQEIQEAVKDNAKACVDEFRSELERKGYEVSLKNQLKVSVEFAPAKMNINVEIGFSATKDGATSYKDKILFSEKSSMYDLIMIASSILNFEARYGDSESTVYMGYYPDIRVRKIKQEQGTAYILESDQTKEQFGFATRSRVFPAGYGIGGVNV